MSYNELDMRKYRSELWLISSGAKRERKFNPRYYEQILNNYPEYITSIYEKTIINDLSRTFPSEPEFNTDSNIKKLKNILIAYSRRNAVVGYIQGFNFIVGRLLQVVKDEVSNHQNNNIFFS